MATSVPGTARMRLLWKSQLLRSSAVYMSGSLLTAAVPFLLLPVLTRLLTPGELGTLAMFMLAVNLLDPIVGFSTHGAIGRKYYDRHEISFGNFLTNSLYLLAGTTVVIAILFLFAARSLGGFLRIPGAWLWIALALSVFRYLINAAQMLCQVKEQPLRFTLISVAQSLGVLVLSIVFVAVLDLGWEGRALGELLTLSLLAGVSLVIWFHAAPFEGGVSREHLRYLGRFGSGLVAHNYGGLLIAATDRFLLTRLVGLEATGLFVVGAQLAMIIGLFERSFNTAWVPWLFERLKRDTLADRRIIARITLIYNAGILIAAATLALGAPLILRVVVGEQYRGAAPFLMWLTFGAAFTGMYRMVVNPLFFYNRTNLLSAVTFGTGLVNVALSYFLIKANGAIGAAQATTATLLLMYVLTAWVSASVVRAERQQAARVA